MIKDSIAKRMVKAIEKDPSIVATVEDIRDSKHAGSTAAHLESLGLSKSDLKALEAAGCAFQARTRNIWGPGEVSPDGREVPKGHRAVGAGSRVVFWLLTK